MKISKRQLRRIIKEEKAALAVEEPSHVDEEVSMAVNQLQAIAATAIELSDLIRDMDYVPEWGDGKIAVVLDKLTSIRSYMVGKSISETAKLKITSSQLKRIIKEEKAKLLKEQPTGWDNFSPEAEAEDEMHLAAEDLPELLRAIESNKEYAAGSNMADTYMDDAGQLQSIYDMSKDAFENMQTDPPDQLQDYISRLDTMVREQIPTNLYNWIVGQR